MNSSNLPSQASQTNSTRQRRRYPYLDKKATAPLRSWLMENTNHPYPTKPQKKSLMQQSGLSKRQLDIWFMNARKVQTFPIKNKFSFYSTIIADFEAEIVLLG